MNINLGLHFAWVVDDAKCIVVTRVSVCVCVCVCLSVCLSAAACPQYCTDPNVTGGVVGDAPSTVHGLRCYGNITRTWNVSEYMLVLALCLVLVCERSQAERRRVISLDLFALWLSFRRWWVKPLLKLVGSKGRTPLVRLIVDLLRTFVASFD